MPSIAKGSKVLVSGANGYIAMWVVRTLLERGYLVRGTVRTQDKGEVMVDYFQKLGYGDKFEFFVVEDIAKEGAFDEALKDVDAIEHLATPVQFTIQDPLNLIRPAVQGTVGILKSAKKKGTQVKRIVVTSSVAAILSLSQLEKPTKFTEKDWNTISTKEVDDLGIKASPLSIYSASKTLAEKAAWDFYNQNESEVLWDLVTINPTYVFGPAIHNVQSISSLNLSLNLWYNAVVKDTPKTKELLSQSINYVDVRDTALSHVLALEKEEAGGERIISSAGNIAWQEWLDAANSLKPNPLPSHQFSKGYPEILSENIDSLVILDNSKEQTILGLKYKTKLETTKDSLEFLASLETV